MQSDRVSAAPLDLARGLHRLRGNRALLNRLLRLFAVHHRDAPAQIEALRAVGDMAAVRRMLHTLKGVAETLGLSGVADGARALESNPRDVVAHVALAESVARVVTAIDALADAPPKFALTVV